MTNTLNHDPEAAMREEIVPAATVVIFRDKPDSAPELLMVQRSRELRFAGGAAVFPGGKVDPGDRVLAARLCPDDDPVVSAARIAAIRETLEETGLAITVREKVSPEEVAAARKMLLQDGQLAPVLDAFGWTLQPEQLTLYAHWRAPRRRSFDVHFFVHDLRTGAVEVAVDATENTRLFWTTATGALQLADTGKISVIFPTRRNLERLAGFRDFADAIADIERYPVDRLCPQIVERDGEPWLQIPEGRGYPVTGQPLAAAERG